MIASGLLWYDDDAHRPLALKLAEAAQRYRERVGYEPTTCQLNPSQAPAAVPAPTSDSVTRATPKRASARRGSRKAGLDLPPITLALIPDAGLRPNYFFIGVAEGEPLKRASIFHDDDNDELLPTTPTVRHHRKNTNTQSGNKIGNDSGEISGRDHRRTSPLHAGEGADIHTSQKAADSHPKPSRRTPTFPAPFPAIVPATSPASKRTRRSPLQHTAATPPTQIEARPADNTSVNNSGKIGNRTNAPTGEQNLLIHAAAPSVTAAPSKSAPPRKTKTPAKTATIATSPATFAGEPKSRTKKAANPPASTIAASPTTQPAPSRRKTQPAASTHAAKTATANAPARKTATSPAKTATPPPAVQVKSPTRRVPAQAKSVAPHETVTTPPAKPAKTKIAAKTAKPAPPAKTAAPRSVKAKSPAKTAKAPATQPKPPATKSATAPATSRRRATGAPPSATQPSTTRSAKTKIAAKTAKPATREATPSTPTASTKTKIAAKTATSPGKVRPQPEASQANLWGEPVAVEPRRKARRTA